MAERRRYPFPTSSQLERIVKCPASFWGKPDPVDHPALKKEGDTAADTGTKLHACIEAGFGAVKMGRPYLQSNRWDRLLAIEKAMELDVSDLFQDAIPIIDETFRRIGCTKTDYGWHQGGIDGFLVEVPVGLTREHKTVSPENDPYLQADIILCGRADLMTFGKDDSLYLVDWKFGAHKVENPDSNLQLISLAIMSLINYSKTRQDFNMAKVKLILSYPTLGGLVEYEGDLNELVKTFRERVVPVIEPQSRLDNGIKYNNGDQYNNGDHCLYCPRRGVCPFLADAGFAFAAHMRDGL